MALGRAPVTGYTVRKRLGWVLLYAFLLLVALFALLPLLYAFFNSFKPLNDLLMNGARLLPSEWRFRNYLEAWQRANFSAYTLNTVYISAGVVFFDLLGTSMLGYVLARKRLPGGRIIEGLLAATIFLGLGTITLYPKTVIALNLGLLNLNGIVLIKLSALTAVHTFLVRAFCKSIHQDVYDAATIDGAGFFGIYWRISLPLMTPILATTAILAFKLAWNGFQVPFVFTLSRPELRTVPVGLFLLKDGAGSGLDQWHLLMAGTMISLLPVILLFVLFQKAFIRNLGGGMSK